MNPQLRQFVLDAGALIALERADPRIRAVFDEAARQRIELVLPTTVLAQVWRRAIAKRALLVP